MISASKERYGLLCRYTMQRNPILLPILKLGEKIHRILPLPFHLLLPLIFMATCYVDAATAPDSNNLELLSGALY
jgi:hypothetical protein